MQLLSFFQSPVRYDKLESISLPLPAPGSVLLWKQHTLIELFSRFVSSEIVHDVECDGCASRCDAVKTLTLGKLPKCLCIHIPRTTWSSSGMPIKRDDPVVFSDTLVLDPFTFIEAKKRLAKVSKKKKTNNKYNEYNKYYNFVGRCASNVASYKSTIDLW